MRTGDIGNAYLSADATPMLVAAYWLIWTAMADRMSLIWVPKKASATTATTTISETIRAYSARLWPRCADRETSFK